MDRWTWIEQFGALTLDTIFRSGAVVTCANAPYKDVPSLVRHARGLLEAMPDGWFHAYCSVRRADIVIGGEDLLCWDGTHLDPCTPLTFAETASFAGDAVLRDAAGALESQGIEAALRPIERALATAPARPELMTFLPPLMRIGKFSLAGKLIDQRLKVDPDDVRALLEDAQITLNLVAEGQWGREHLAGAEVRLNRILRAHPEHERAQLMWCDLPRYGGEPAGSVPRFEALLARHPEWHAAHYNLGAIHLAGHEPARALHHFELGGVLAPDDADYPLGCARALLALGRPDAARDALETGRRLAPSHRLISGIERELGG